MSQTQIPVGHPLARKIYSVAVFNETHRRPSLRKNLTGPAPKQGQAEAKAKGQTSPDFPIVRVTDLAKGAGDMVSVDMFNIVSGKPVMGDKKLSGRMMAMTSSSMDIRVDQYRAGVDAGGRMAQQRTVHRLRSLAKANLSGYAARMEDQLALVHMAGHRGAENTPDWVVPPTNDPDFAEIAVNPVLPPTPGRRFFAGDATSVGDLATTDYFTLGEIERLRAVLDEMAFPMQPIRLPGDPAADEEPLFMLLLTSRQWHWLKSQTSERDWRTFLASAHERSRGWNHPLFTGSPGMWEGILIRKMSRAVRTPAGLVVPEYADASLQTINQVEAAVDTDRALLLGAQALGECYGAHGESGYHAKFHEETTDHGNAYESSIAFMGGKAKLRFKGSEGTWEDHGVMTIDSYAPDPRAA